MGAQSMARKGMIFGIFLAPFHRVGDNPTLAIRRDIELIEWLDHLGFDEATRTELAVIRARPIGVGPLSLHAEDVIAIVSNEIDRREASRRP